jgi:hypothetical protein
MLNAIGNPTLETEDMVVVHSYIKDMYENVFSWEIENLAHPEIHQGVRQLSTFCENLGFNEKLLRAEIASVRKIGEKYCIYKGWKISWTLVDDFRSICIDAKIPLAPRFKKINGKRRTEKKDYEPGDYELAKITERFKVGR